MKVIHSAAALALVCAVLGQSLAQSQDSAKKSDAAVPEASAAAADLKDLVSKIRERLRNGAASAADLAEELKAFDALGTKYKDQKEDAAEILFMKGTLYLHVLRDKETGEKLLQQVKKEFPGTKHASIADNVMASAERAAEAAKAKESLVGKAAPALHFKWASREGLKTLGELKGKVVVLDFWATWCGPCVSSFPNIKELTEHYRGYDVEIIGVTSIQGRVHGLDAKTIDCKGDEKKELDLMTKYMDAKDINWTIAFTQEQVFNPEYGVTGIPHMTIIGPDGKVAQNGIHPGATPLAKKTAVIDKLLKDANLKTPPST